MVSRLDIINRTLEYLEKGDVNGAIEYLRLAKEMVLKEVAERAKRPRTDPIVRCKQLLEGLGGESAVRQKIEEHGKASIMQS